LPRYDLLLPKSNINRAGDIQSDHINESGGVPRGEEVGQAELLGSSKHL
jgi:hypothetical protein